MLIIIILIKIKIIHIRTVVASDGHEGESVIEVEVHILASTTSFLVLLKEIPN